MSVDDSAICVQYPARGHRKGIWHPRNRHTLSLLRFGAVSLEPGTRIERNGSGPFWRMEEYEAPVQTRTLGEESWQVAGPQDIIVRPPWTVSERTRMSACRHRYLAVMLPDDIEASMRPSRPIRIVARNSAMNTSPFAAALMRRGTLTSSERMELLATASQCLAAYFAQEPCGEEVETERHPSELSRAILFLQAELSSPVTVARIAKNAGCSPSHLNRLFQLYLDASVMQYVIRQRVLKAAELLIASEASLEHIAEACGFTTRHYMTRIFTRELGTPPARFRQENRLG